MNTNQTPVPKPFPRTAYGVLPFLILSLLAGSICLERLHTFHEPIERDITNYAVIGHEMLAGGRLYSDLWDCKAPAVYSTFSAAEKIAGYGDREVLLLGVTASIATLFLVFGVGVLGGFGTWGGVTAAVFWAVLSGDLHLQANQPNIEVFLNVFLTLAFWAFLKMDPVSLRPKTFLFLGSMVLAATLYKQNAFLFFPLVGAAYVLLTGRSLRTRTALLQVSGAFGVVLLGWVAVVWYFASTGRIEDFKYAVFDFHLHYDNLGIWSPAHYLEQVDTDIQDRSTSWFLVPLLAVGFAGAWMDRRRNPRPWVLWLAFLTASEIEVLSTGRFHPHYYQLLLPPLVIGAAWGSVRLGRALPKGRAVLSALPAMLLLTVLVAREAPFYFLSPDEWSRAKYGNAFLETYRIAGAIDPLLKPGETFFTWGGETELYFATRRRPPTGQFYGFAFPNPAMDGKFTARMIGDLDRNKPELLVLDKPDLERQFSNPVLAWLRTRYRHIPWSNDGEYRLFMRKGGDLEGRLAQKASR